MLISWRICSIIILYLAFKLMKPLAILYINNSMQMSNYIKQNKHIRKRNGHLETVHTKQTVYVLKCDCCGKIYNRPSKQHKSVNKHVCSECNHYKFAQTISVQSRRINQYVNQIDASSSKPLGTFIFNPSSS